MNSRDVTKDEQSKTSLNGTVSDFSVDYSSVKKENILNIYQNLIFQNTIKKYLNFLKKYLVKASNHKRCVALSNH